MINKGELFFLGQPGTETIFSDFGPTVQPDSKAHLVGLLMVDRPKPADPDGLKQVENAFSEYQIAPMTSTGERDIQQFSIRTRKGATHFKNSACEVIRSPESASHLPYLELLRGIACRMHIGPEGQTFHTINFTPLGLGIFTDIRVDVLLLFLLTFTEIMKHYISPHVTSLNVKLMNNEHRPIPPGFNAQVRLYRLE